MLDEVLPHIQERSLMQVADVAGLLAASRCDERSASSDTMVVAPLGEALRALVRSSVGRRAALVVTANGHTTCFLTDGRARLFHFDSLPASLTDVTWEDPSRLAMRHARTSSDEYSAVALFEAAPPI